MLAFSFTTICRINPPPRRRKLALLAPGGCFTRSTRTATPPAPSAPGGPASHAQVSSEDERQLEAGHHGGFIP